MPYYNVIYYVGVLAKYMKKFAPMKISHYNIWYIIIILVT